MLESSSSLGEGLDFNMLFVQELVVFLILTNQIGSQRRATPYISFYIFSFYFGCAGHAPGYYLNTGLYLRVFFVILIYTVYVLPAWSFVWHVSLLHTNKNERTTLEIRSGGIVNSVLCSSQIRWTKTAGSVSDRFQDSSVFNETLHIAKIQRTQGGRYYCKAENGLGSPAIKSIRVDVYCKYAWLKNGHDASFVFYIAVSFYSSFSFGTWSLCVGSDFFFYCVFHVFLPGLKKHSNEAEKLPKGATIWVCICVLCE